jgi:murein DD-endopeptidase MepM/ murein hydrolase activator NlpD
MKFYRVKQGDTLEAIAEIKHVGVSSLRAANKRINPDKLRAGQLLVIPEPEPVPETAPETVTPDPEPVPEPVPETVTPDPDPAPVEGSDKLVTIPLAYLDQLKHFAAIGEAYIKASEAFKALPESKELLTLVCPTT